MSKQRSNKQYSSECKRLEQFLSYFQAIKGRSPQTIREYRYDLELLMRWLIQHRGLAPNDQPFGEISVASVDDAFLQSIQLSELYGFIGWLSIEKQNGPAARARRVSAIRTFFTYLQNKVKILETNVALELESPKKIKSLPRHLTLDQSMTLLDTVGSSDSEWSTRDYCIITFF